MVKVGHLPIVRGVTDGAILIIIVQTMIGVPNILIIPLVTGIALSRIIGILSPDVASDALNVSMSAC